MMNQKKYIGVFWTSDDLDCGPFVLRLCGTNSFVSKIDPTDISYFPAGSVDTVTGWDNPIMLQFPTMDDAIRAGAQAWEFEGCHIHVEALGR